MSIFPILQGSRHCKILESLLIFKPVIFVEIVLLPARIPLTVKQVPCDENLSRLGDKIASSSPPKRQGKANFHSGCVFGKPFGVTQKP